MLNRTSITLIIIISLLLIVYIEAYKLLFDILSFSPVYLYLPLVFFTFLAISAFIPLKNYVQYYKTGLIIVVASSAMQIIYVTVFNYVNAVELITLINVFASWFVIIFIGLVALSIKILYNYLKNTLRE